MKIKAQGIKQFLEKLRSDIDKEVARIEKEMVVCDECGGTGYVTEPVWNDDAHVYEPTGSRKCPICNYQE